MRALEEWRLLPAKETPPLPPPIGEATLAVLSRLGLSDRLDEDEVRAEWSSIVGPFLSQHSFPESLLRGTLTVRVTQPTVRFELERMWKARVLEKLQARFGAAKIRAIRFR